jgi:uncharacterized protein
MDTEDLKLPAGEAQQSAPAPQTIPTSTQTIFFGADGLRAGWSALLFLVLFAVLMAGVNAVAQKIHLTPRHTFSGRDTPLSFTVSGEAIPFCGLLLAAWAMSKVERRPNAVYGLGGPRKLLHFGAGLAWGVVCLSLVVLTLWKSGLLVFDGRLLSGRDVVRYGALWLLGFLFVGLREEYLVHGYLQYTLARGLAGLYRGAFNSERSAALGFWTSALLFSVLFGLGHARNPGESPTGLLAAGLIGLVFCLSLWRTGSLWWAIGFHTSWDWAQSFLYGVADSGTFAQYRLLASHPAGQPVLSGGATGPEGSILILVPLALITVIILFTLPRTGAYAANMSSHEGTEVGLSNGS